MREGTRHAVLVGLCFWLTMANGQTAAEPVGKSLVGRKGGICLVEARCTAIDEKDGRALATFVVSRTYIAKEGTITRFQAGYTSHGGSFGDAGPRWPPPTIGEVNLWALETNDKGEWTPRRSDLFGVLWPVRDTEGSNYAQARKLAETVEEAFAADPASQLRILRSAASGDSAPVARWAIYCLGKAPDGAGDGVLRELSSKGEKLPLASQIALDETLANVWHDRWIGSAERARMLGSWVLPEVVTSDSRRVFHRLGVAHQRGELGAPRLFWMVHSIVGDPKIPLAVRRDALILVGRYPEKWNETDRARVFTLLTSVMKKEKAVELRQLAAQIVGWSFVLSPDEMTAIGSIRQRTEDPKLAAILDGIIAAPGTDRTVPPNRARE